MPRLRIPLLAIALTLAGLALWSITPAPASTAAWKSRYRVEIRAVHSKLRADVMWASVVPGQGVFLWHNNTSASQEFDLVATGGLYFTIRARHSGLCLGLDRRARYYGNGTVVTQEPCDKRRLSQQWQRGWVGAPFECDGDICSTTPGTHPVLINRYTRKCLDARNGPRHTPRAQAELQQWTCIRHATDYNAGNQLWRLGNETLPFERRH